MKVIFEESMSAGTYCAKWVRRYVADPAPYVESREYAIRSCVLAKWDKATGVLCVDLTVYGPEYEPEWMLTDRRILETYHRKSDALRRSIGAADGWNAEVSATIPVEESDESVIGQHNSRTEEEVPY